MQRTPAKSPMPSFETNPDPQPTGPSRAGPAHAVGAAFDRFGDDVYSYTLAMLRSAGAAAEATLDVFASMAVASDQSSHPAMVSERGRVDAIARARAEVRSRSKVAGPPSLAEGQPTHSAVLDAIEAFSERDKELLVLTIGIGLGPDELSRVLGVASSQLPDLLARMQRRVETAVGPILLGHEGNDGCVEMNALLDHDSGNAPVALSSAIAQHAATCESCLQRRAELTSPTGPLRSILSVDSPEDLRSRIMAAVAASRAADEHPRPHSVRDMSDRAMWAVFAAVAIVLGLVGMAISAQFEPLDRAPVSTLPAPLVPTTTSTTTEESQTTTAESPDGTTPTSGPSNAAADLGISTDVIDFGQDSVSGQFDLTNGGDDSAEFSIQTSTAAITVSAGSGEIAPGDTLNVELTLDRDEIDEGVIDETIVITWDGSSLEVSITGEHQANPILHSPQASPSTVQEGRGDSCSPTQATVSVRIRDDSRLESVVARWSHDGGGTQETSMVDVGNDIYEGVIGPFTSPRTVEVRIVATDEFGNAGGARVPVTVVECS